MSEATGELFCANHPDTLTALRCNRCEKPICARCAVLTPTGYRCKDCIRGQQKSFETTEWYDYITAPAVSVVLAFIGARLIPSLGFFTIFLSPVAGVIIAEAVRFVVRRRRSRRLFLLTAGFTALGAVLQILLTLIPALIFFSQGGMGSLWGLLWQGVYTFVVTTSVYYRLSGLRL